MDPFSISVGCLALVAAVQSATGQISNLIRVFHAARPEMLRMSTRLNELNHILNLIHHDSSDDCNPQNKQGLNESQHLIPFQINQCLDIVDELQAMIKDYQNTPQGRSRWTLTGKVAVKALEASLEGHIGHLQLSLNLDARWVHFKD